jgi:hypothetical protein
MQFIRFHVCFFPSVGGSTTSKSTKTKPLVLTLTSQSGAPTGAVSKKVSSGDSAVSPSEVPCCHSVPADSWDEF